MKIVWTELLDHEAPLALRRRGLVQLSALTLLLQLLHLGLAWLAVPDLSGLPQWVTWGVSGFFTLLLLAIGALQIRLLIKKPRLEPVRQVFLSAFWLGAACLAAIFAARLGFHLGVGFFCCWAAWATGLPLGACGLGCRKRSHQGLLRGAGFASSCLI
jgi:hypothetical protein